jgi:hypothetical protein
VRREFKRGLIRGVSLAIVAVAVVPAIADAASRFIIPPQSWRFHIFPPQPSSTSTIRVIFKVPEELPKDQRWMLGITDYVSGPQSCARSDRGFFNTRGVKGAVLVATFRPEDTNATAWCTGSPRASTWLLIAVSATRRGKFRPFAGRLFTIT